LTLYHGNPSLINNTNSYSMDTQWPLNYFILFDDL